MPDQPHAANALASATTPSRPPRLRMAIALCGVVAGPACAADSSADADRVAGEQQYQRHCAVCHNGSFPEALTVDALRLYSPQRLVAAMSSGVMSTQALPLSEREIRQVAYFLTGKPVAAREFVLPQYACSQPMAAAEVRAAGNWTGWGVGAGNQRYQGAERTLNRQNVQHLDLLWAFAFPQTTRMRAQPTVTAGVTYIGSQDGTVYALDTNSGCVHWTFTADNEVRGALQLHESGDGQRRTLLFGDFKANAYAVNADSGELLWRTQVHAHPLATITGSVTADETQVYVPVSSSEVVPAASPRYPCCTFRGAVVALSLDDGSLAWRSYTTGEPEAAGKNAMGTDRFAPSGAPVWSSPTVDHKRDLVLVTTGQNYSSPATDTSDALIALDRNSGAIRWVSQVTQGDAWNGACVRKTANCPSEDGPDFDIGTSAILTTTTAGRDVVLVGQKSGLVYAMDPNQQGKILWRQRVGSGGTMGGVHWGMSSDGERVYVGVSDLPTANRYREGEPRPGLYALNPLSGAFIWRSPLPDTCPDGGRFQCFPGISAAVSSSPGLVFAGGLDGMLRAFDARDGAVLWAYNTRQTFTAVNGVAGTGGAIEADGPVIAHGQLFITSGYDKWGELPGNVLLVFALPDE